MNAKALGRFVGEFLEGLAGQPEVTEGRTETPIVVPEDMVRKAVADFLAPMVEQAAQEEPGPSGEQLDMMFDEARAQPHDPLAEATLRRVTEIREREAERERAAAMGERVPPAYDPNMPDSGMPWMAPNSA